MSSDSVRRGGVCARFQMRMENMCIQASVLDQLAVAVSSDEPCAYVTADCSYSLLSVAELVASSG